MAKFYTYLAEAKKANPGLRIQFKPGKGYFTGPQSVSKPVTAGVGGSPSPTPSVAAGTPVAPPTQSVEDIASASVHKATDPILAELQRRQDEERAYLASQNANQGAGIDKAVADARQPLADVYNSGIQQQTAIEQSVANRLQGKAGENTQDFAKRLALIGAPHPDQSVGELATTYKGANAAEYASGMDDVGRLVARGADARAWLEKQPALEKSALAQNMNTALADLSKQYGASRGDILAQLPGHIQDLVNTLNEQKTAKSQYNQNYALQLRQQRAQEKKDAAEAKLVAFNTMSATQFKKWSKNQDIQQKELDRQLKIDLANQGETGKDARTQAGITSREKIAAAAKSGGTNKDNVNTPGSAKRDRAVKAVNAVLFNPKTQQPRQGVKDKWSNAKIVGTINSQLSAQGIAPGSPAGISIRKAALQRMGIATGPKGNPTG